ncbi:hypothetical protein [Micromonospora sediminicola]|uniref:hypothetical protein n=1 Tax=Micromonospora sediminicola TaxID=946078 RepID=UPI0037912007
MQNLYEPDETATEPLLTVGTITAAVTAALALLVAFGLELSDGQKQAVLGAVAVAAPFIVAAWGRRKVYAPATVAKLLRR